MQIVSLGHDLHEMPKPFSVKKKKKTKKKNTILKCCLLKILPRRQINIVSGILETVVLIFGLLSLFQTPSDRNFCFEVKVV